MNAFDSSGNGAEPPQKRARRTRYKGTHPKNFEQKYKEHNLQAYPEMEAHLRAKGITPVGTHVPVLVQEVIECLTPGPREIVIDCTVGYGGHAMELAKRIGPEGRLIALDIDSEALDRTRLRLQDAGVSASFHRSNFAGIAKVLKQEDLAGFDIIFADLGVSSMQIDNPARGMSYKHPGPLDLRMDDRLKRTGADLLHSLSQEELSKALWELADEPDHEGISRLIVARRASQPITQTSQLVDLVYEAKGVTAKTWRSQQDKLGSLHPAARTFQVLRILVNDELGTLKELLRVSPYCLRPGGRIGIISFHSGEDRLVKKSFREGYRTGVYAASATDVIVPQPEEVRVNPRSASAKFRWAITPVMACEA
jgi:16S rRNA (cytosine1402-N4)-methyltransferase